MSVMDFGSHSSHAVIFSLKRNAIPLSRILVSKNLYVQRNVLPTHRNLLDDFEPPYPSSNFWSTNDEAFTLSILRCCLGGLVVTTYLPPQLPLKPCLLGLKFWAFWGAALGVSQTHAFDITSEIFMSIVSIGSTIPTLNYFLCTLLSPIRFLNSSS